jgi:regulatory protein
MAGVVSGEPPVMEGGRITLLEAQKRRPQRLNVHLDDAYAFSVDASVTLAAGLRVGDLLDASAIQGLLEADERESAHGRALHFLGTRERSRHEVEVRLRRYGYEDGVVEKTVGWLAGLGYLDDAHYASSYVREKERAGWGPRRIAAELARRGVAPGVTAAALSEAAAAGGDEEARARSDDGLAALVRRRFQGEWERDPESARRRAYSFLARRGHGWERIDQVLRVAFATGDEPGDARA